MKHLIINILCLFSLGSVCAQTPSDFEQFRRQQQDEFTQFKQGNQEKFDRFRDSLNRRYADFLAQEWKAYPLQKPEPPIKRPIVVPPVYDANKPQPAPVELPAPAPIIPAPAPAPVTPVPPVVEPPTPTPAPQTTLAATLFGTEISLSKLPIPALHLSDSSNQAISAFWRALSDIPSGTIADDAMRIKSELALNDWGLYDLLGTMFQTYFRAGNANEQVVFTVFMLNQMGYQAKIGRSGNELLPLIAFVNQVTNCMYFRYGTDTATKYYTVAPNHKIISSVETCPIDYTEGLHQLDLAVAESPKFAQDVETKSLAFNKATYPVQVNRNVVDFYEDYPCTDFSLYAAAPVEPLAWQSIEEQIKPAIAGKSQAEAVNWLLHFVQNAFAYKADPEQFGYEKFFFAEETLASSFSDCEDHAILFTQLVRRLLDMPVVLIYYKDVHLATAVRFDDATLSGDYVLVDGAKYLICDPTYTGADLGHAMPDLRKMSVIIYK